MLFPYSILPCDCRCRGLPFIILIFGYNDIRFKITDAVNSLPLSDCKITGGPISVKISNKHPATSIALFEVIGLAQEYRE